MDHAAAKTHILEALSRALDRVDPWRMVHDNLDLEGDCLAVRGVDRAFDLSEFRRVVLLGAGKAGAPMARAVQEILGPRIAESLVLVKYGHRDSTRGPLPGVRLVEAGHPVPDQAGLAGTRELLKIARDCDAETLVIMLTSGGGSALLSAPQHPISLNDIQETTRLLLESGATIQDVNTVRIALSAVKGGRLAEALYPATVINLVLSDVVGDRLDIIASGPCVPGTVDRDQALAVLDTFKLLSRVPPTVRSLLEDPTLPPPPRADAPCFKKVYHALLGTNRQALEAAAQSLEEQGMETFVLSSMITGEAREVARVFAGIALDAARQSAANSGAPGEPPSRLAEDRGSHPAPLVIIAGGETTVRVRGNGKGGRNQELALAFLCELAKAPRALADRITALAAATDGTDGPTDAAGAWASTEVLERAQAAGLNPASYLEDNDAWHFFNGTGDLLFTGPTNTNVCDLTLILVDRSPQGPA